MAAIAPLKIYVGYDAREDIAWQVCRHSILRHARGPVEVHPLRQPALRDLGLYTRAADPGASTEFSLTRFLTPYLAAHDGWTLFVDCDVLFTRDVAGVLDGLDPGKAAYVVKHDYVPAQALKMDGRVQSVYARKNWSSFMLFNGAHADVRALTPAVVDTASPGFLHRLEWISEETSIGALDRDWNFLVGEYPEPSAPPAAIHFTNGGPWFAHRKTIPFADLWHAEKRLYLKSLQPRARIAPTPLAAIG